MPQLSGLDHLVLTCSDIAETVQFYTRVLRMQAVEFNAADGSRRWALQFGAQKINLHAAGQEFRPHAQAPTPGSADLCFLTEVALDDWIAHLRAEGVRVIDGPVARTGARGSMTSIYLRDPDGNLIEVSKYD